MISVTPGNSDADSMEHAALRHASARIALTLYISGGTIQSSRAVINLRRYCEEHLKDRYELQVVDISLSPALAATAQIIATPTLIKTNPLPVRRMVGDLSQTNRLQVILGIAPAPPSDLASSPAPPSQ